MKIVKKDNYEINIVFVIQRDLKRYCYSVLTKGNAAFKLRKILHHILLSNILVRSFAEFVPMVFEKYGVDFFLSCELNQDPIE